MKVQKTSLKGVLTIEPQVFRDKRGFFTETFQQERYDSQGIGEKFVQDNVSHSIGRTLRGLHFQYPNAQAKLVQVFQGEIFDVAVDIRKGSPSFGQWEGVHLSDKNHLQLFIPEGFAHGFVVLSDFALVNYKCSDFYSPESEGGIIWKDPDIGITWPVREPCLSEKDARYPLLKELDPAIMPP
jgi:dTDP-4-dehydrorhamnose 3,5-epimerase